MRVTVVDTIDRLEPLENAWRELHAADGYAPVFLSWPWIRACVDCTPKQWLVLVASDGDEGVPAALLPLGYTFVKRRKVTFRELGMLGTPLADYTSFLCRPDREDDAIRAIAEYVAGGLPWDALELRDVDDPRLDAFLSRFGTGAFEVARADDMPCMRLELPGTWEAYLQDVLNTKARRNVRKALRELEELEGGRVTTATGEDLDHHLDTVFELWQARWGARPAAVMERHRTVFRRCFDDGSLYVKVLWDGERPMAGVVAFPDRDRGTVFEIFNSHAAETRLRSPGQAVVATSVRHAIEQGFRAYDFLRGEEEYKRFFGASTRTVARASVARRSLVTLARKLLVGRR